MALNTGIISRPVYPGLIPDPHAKSNLILAEGEGAQAVIDMGAKAPPGFFARTTVLYCPSGVAEDGYTTQLERLQPLALWVLPTTATALFRLQGVLQTATMGIRLYATGTEPFIGLVVQAGMAAGMDFKSIITEHRGSAKRRVQCVHCKGFIEDVTTSIVACTHCGLKLFVRDHYSRRLAAFQGVCVDAEAPGEVPPAEEIYQ